MRFTYDRSVDVLVIQFNDHHVAESDEIAPGIIVDLSDDQTIVRMEILDASQKVDDPSSATTA